MSLNVFVSLKQPDLHAISALASLKSLLGDDAPTQLFRCRHLVFSKSDGSELSDSFLAPLLANRFDIVNPNKEAISWHVPPTVNLPDGQHVFWVDVTSRTPNVPDKVHFSGQDLDMLVGITWGIVLPSRGFDEAALKSWLSNTLLFGDSPAAGLLVNPVLETAQFF